jgi:hypothetical protein
MTVGSGKSALKTGFVYAPAGRAGSSLVRALFCPVAGIEDGGMIITKTLQSSSSARGRVLNNLIVLRFSVFTI